MHVFKQTLIDLDNRQAKNIQEFYYKDTEYESPGPGQGTGVRDLARDYFRNSKVKERHVILKDNGNTLEVATYFATKKDCLDFCDEPVVRESLRFFEDRNFKQTTELYEIQDELSIRKLSFETMRNELRYFSTSCTDLDQVKERVNEIFTGSSNAKK
jgi:hypothetical protein|tara:strand:- start:1317 stop:1787 length:471 start_codon:yes stop_codon:yes gene_type:complete